MVSRGADRPALPERFAIIGISLTIMASALAVAGVFLIAACGPETTPQSPPVTLICTYPFRWSGVAMLFVATVPLPLLALYSYVRFEAERGRGWALGDRPAGALVLLGAVATFFFWLLAWVILVARP